MYFCNSISSSLAAIAHLWIRKIADMVKVLLTSSPEEYLSPFQPTYLARDCDPISRDAFNLRAWSSQWGRNSSPMSLHFPIPWLSIPWKQPNNVQNGLLMQQLLQALKIAYNSLFVHAATLKEGLPREDVVMTSTIEHPLREQSH